VISVGNIQAGGAGKTPITGYIAREAAARGLKVCILTRGYRGVWEKTARGGVISPGQTAVTSDCGDEAMLLRELAPDAWIGVGRDREAQFKQVTELSPIDLVILDDGFQNFWLHKDVELVAVTSARPGERIFRDFKSSLKKTDLVLWTKGDERPEVAVPMIRIHFRLAPSHSRPAGGALLFVSGLADGVEALRSVEAAGYIIQRHLFFPDHATYTRKQVDQILAQAESEGLSVAVTGKDWVKWRELGVSPTRVVVLEPEVVISDTDRGLWERVLWGA
jgi:tetraacyldisaccharide 4'-kinase